MRRTYKPAKMYSTLLTMSKKQPLDWSDRVGLTIVIIVGIIVAASVIECVSNWDEPPPQRTYYNDYDGGPDAEHEYGTSGI